MFKKLIFLSLCALPLVAGKMNANSIKENKKYGVSVGITQDSFDQLEKMCDLTKIDSPDCIGIESEKGAFIFLAQDYAEAEQLKNLLEKENYAAEIIEVVTNGPDANVITLAQMSDMAEQLNTLLPDLNIQ